MEHSKHQTRTFIKKKLEEINKKGTMAAELDKAVQVLPFSGKREDWRMWSRKFLTRAKIKGYKAILMRTETPPRANTMLDPMDNSPAAQIKLRDINKLTYSELLLACQEEVCFGAINKAMTTEKPEGLASLAWANLTARYKPRTSATKIELKQEFIKSKLESVDINPDKWITNLEQLCQCLKNM